MENVVAISIMVVGGVLLAIIVSAICGNRKLRRHKECCRKDPHVPGMETNKSLRVEIERRVERVGEIKYEPLLLSPELPAPKHEQDQYYNRMKALDHLCYLERELSRLPGVTPRLPHETLRGFLLRLTVGGGSGSTPIGGAVLRGLEPRLLHQLCDQHAHARYHPQPFTRHNLTHTHALMLRVLHCGRSGGAKSLGSDDHLKAPSDHDSAIDADPIELEPSDDERNMRQQQVQQNQHYQRQQHKQQQCLTTTAEGNSSCGPQQYTQDLCPTDRSSLLVGGAGGGGGGRSSGPGGKASFFSTHTFPPAPSKSGAGVAAALGYPSPVPGVYPHEIPNALITSTGASTGYRYPQPVEGGRSEGSGSGTRREGKLRKPKKRPGHLKIQDEEES